MHKILLSGSNGFVGKSIVNLLSEYNFTYYSRKNNTQITDENIVIHAAGLAHNSHNDNKWYKYRESNVQLTKIIFDSFLNSNAEIFIFFSTSKVSGLIDGILTEDEINKKLNVYSKSKLLAENYINGKKSLKKKIYIIRPSLIVGDNLKGNLKMLHILSSTNIPWLFGSITNLISILDMRNLSYIIEKIIEGNIPTGTYNLANNEPLKVNDLFLKMKEKRNKKFISFNIPHSLLKKIFELGSFLKIPLLNINTFNKLSENSIVSTIKLKNVIGHLPFSNEDTINKYL